MVLQKRPNARAARPPKALGRAHRSHPRPNRSIACQGAQRQEPEQGWVRTQPSPGAEMRVTEVEMLSGGHRRSMGRARAQPASCRAQGRDAGLCEEGGGQPRPIL
jgi:hypothetical protein